MSRTLPRAILLLIIFSLGSIGAPAALAAKAAKPLSRTAFLKKVDRALARGNAKDVAALADWDAWTKDGNPDPKSLRLALPSAPLKRDKELNERELIYRDASGRSWKLNLQSTQETPSGPVRWSLPILTRPCPQGAQRMPVDDAAPPIPPPPTTWTPLECWPLPM